MSYIVRAMTHDGSARVVVMNSLDIVKRGAEIHHTTPAATAALGRVLTGTSLMGCLMGNRDDLLTLRFHGDGTGGTVIASSDYYGNVRGCIKYPDAQGSDVADIIGRGQLYVLRDVGEAENYVGVAEINSGSVDDDITAYCCTSEQVPTICVLDVCVDGDGQVTTAGGIFMQLLPGADEQVTRVLEKNISSLGSLGELLVAYTPEGIMEQVMQGVEYDLFDRIDCEYLCTCSRERTAKALATLGKKDIDDLIADGGAELSCQFCDKKYKFDVDDLRQILREAEAK